MHMLHFWPANQNHQISNTEYNIIILNTCITQQTMVVGNIHDHVVSHQEMNEPRPVYYTKPSVTVVSLHSIPVLLHDSSYNK